MKDFNIAKYLRENSLGSHAILGRYVDLHALKEEEVGNNKPVDEVPYVGTDKKLDGFGDEFDQVAPVEEAEIEENAWMEDVDGTDAYKIGNWTCYYDHPGVLVWSYGDTPLSELAVYATPNYDGDDTTPIQIAMDGENEDMMAIDKGIFADFNEYARAMKPYFDMVERMLSDQGSEAPVEEMDNSVTGDKGWQYDDDEEDSSWMKDDRFAELGGNELKSAIKSLMDDGFEDREIAQFVVDTIRAFKSFKREEVSVSSSGVEMEESLQEVTAWEEKLRYYESEVNDLIHDMIDTTQASSDQVADFFQYISTQVRNQGNF